MDGVFLLVGLDDKRTVGLKVQSFDDRQDRVAATEVDTDLLGILAFRFQKIAFCCHLGEGQQRDIVGQEVGIGCLSEGIDMKGVAPDGIDPDIRFGGRDERVVVIGNHLAFL